MKRRLVLAVLCALALLGVDFFSAPFLLSGASPYVQNIFYLPIVLAEQFLSLTRSTWGWPHAPEEGLSLTDSWSSALVYFNWFCYAALGFMLGLRLGTRLEERERIRCSVSPTQRSRQRGSRRP